MLERTFRERPYPFVPCLVCNELIYYFHRPQFARYLCHQIVADLPDRFMGVESSDDEEEEAGSEWLG